MTIQVNASPAFRAGFVDGVPSAVLRFAVRSVVDEDEVQIAWGVEWDPAVLDAVTGMDTVEASKLIRIVDRLPACAVIMVQGLSDLSRHDLSNGLCPRNGVTPSAVTAAMLCAMKHVLVTEDVLPIRYRKSEVSCPSRRLPPGWRMEIDIDDPILIASYQEDLASDPRFQGIQSNPAVPYGRFLWVALDGEVDRMRCISSDAIQRLRTDAPTETRHPVCIQARKSHAQYVKSPAGPLALTRHAIQRAGERLQPGRSPGKVASWLSHMLFTGLVYDVTSVVSGCKRRKLHARLRVLARMDSTRLLIFVVAVERDADYLATVYPASLGLDAAIRDAVPTLPAMRH